MILSSQLIGNRKVEKNEICGQLCHNNVSSRSPLPSCRIKTPKRDYLYILWLLCVLWIWQKRLIKLIILHYL